MEKKKIVVAGLINIETTQAIGSFPIEYNPIDYTFFGIESTVSGVGYNVSKAVKSLGSDVTLLSLIGKDMYKECIYKELEKSEIRKDGIIESLDQIPQSIVLYDKDGKRKIYLDLKDIQDMSYPVAENGNVFNDADIAVICNINFARSLFPEAKKFAKKIASDVHVVSDINDDFNKEFMQNADILFMSNEGILGREEAFIHEVAAAYDNEIIVIGMGSAGALLYEKKTQEVTLVEAVQVRDVVSTIGAGDALFSAFIHFYSKGDTPKEALQKAVYFAGYKIGEKGAACGFITEDELLKLYQNKK